MKRRTMIGISLIVTSLMIFSVIAVQSGYLKADKSLSQEIPSVNEQATPSQEDICDGVDSDQPTGSQLGISEIQGNLGWLCLGKISRSNDWISSHL